MRAADMSSPSRMSPQRARSARRFMSQYTAASNAIATNVQPGLIMNIIATQPTNPARHTHERTRNVGRHEGLPIASSSAAERFSSA